MASIKSVLTNYFKQLHFNSMDPAVRNRWNEYLKLNDLNNSMKDWRNQLMHKDADGKFVNNELPNIFDTLSDDQIMELYKQMNNAVSGMAADKRLNNAEFAAAKSFVDEFYGENELFHLAPLDSVVSDSLADIFTKKGNEDLLKPILKKDMLPEGLSFDELITGIGDKKYDKDADFRRKLKEVIENLDSAILYGSLLSNVSEKPEQKALINRIVELKDKLEPEPKGYDIAAFKRNLAKNDDKNVLVRLYKKSKLREVFASHDHGGVIAALDGAREEVNYDKKDSDNFLYPKTEKNLNFPQTIKKKWDDFSENRLEKWHNLGGDRMFESPQAKDIVKAIKKENIKPTDGLAAILDKAENIKKNMGHSTISTGKHFEWFLKEMNAIKDENKENFEACLFSGVSLRNVVQRICKDGAKNNAEFEKAKTALEILSTIKYENTTSKTLDALKAYYKDNTDGILNNKDLSWNKNPSIQFITNAMTKTFRVGGIALATMATVAVNSVRKMGSNIKTENKDLAAAHNEWKADNASQKAALGERVEAAKGAKADAEAQLAAMDSQKDIDTNLKNQQEAMAKIKKNIEPKLASLQKFAKDGTNSPDDIIAVQEFLQAYDELEQDGTPIPNSVVKNMPTKLNYVVKDIMDELRSYGTTSSKLKTAENKKQAFEDATKALKNATAEMDKTQKEIDGWDSTHKDLYAELVKHWNKLEKGRDIHLGRAFGGHYSHWGSKEKQQEKFFWKIQQERAAA